MPDIVDDLRPFVDAMRVVVSLQVSVPMVTLPGLPDRSAADLGTMTV